MMRTSFLIPCLILPVAAFACGSGVQITSTGTGGATAATGATGTTTSTGAPTGGDTATGTGASTSASSGTGGSATGCPPMPPADLSTCDMVGLDCEYGSDPRPACRAHYRCMTIDGPGTWVPMQPKCPAIPAGTCPTTPAATGACDPNGLLCPFPSGAECDCSNCPGPCGPTASWQCTPAPAAGCPTTAPNLGQPCGTAGLSCQYGTCGGATAMNRVCKMGVWTDEGVTCPN